MCCLFHYIIRLHCANGRRGSCSITVTRIEAEGYQARNRVLYLVLSLQIGTEAYIDFFEWVLHLKLWVMELITINNLATR